MHASLEDFTAAVARLGELRESGLLRVKLAPLGSVSFNIDKAAEDVPPLRDGIYADIYDVLATIAADVPLEDFIRARGEAAEDEAVARAKYEAAASAFPRSALRGGLGQRVRRNQRAWIASALIALGRRTGRLGLFMTWPTFRKVLGEGGRRSAWIAMGAKIGDPVKIGPGVWLRVPSQVSIGDGCKLGGTVMFESYGEVSIGRNVIINDSYLYTTQHDVNDPGFKAERRTITIGDYAWLPRKVIVLPGVHIGNYAVIGTGSVVANDIPDYGVAVGNPARVVKERARIKYTYVPSSVHRSALID
jgi:acetyltransferase-like isoleucine patch superfamily enzyme